ncbi:MAG: LpxI family protein [Limisphaerales bacterium]|jgi:DUF1009 family protein
MPDHPQSLGIIAGNRSLPILVAREARQSGVQHIVAVAFEGETNPELARHVDHIAWIRVGQLTKMIQAFQKQNVHHCIMAGQIAPKNLFDVRPDLRALGLLLKLKTKNAHTIFGAIADELRKDGIELIEATPWLRPFMPSQGFHLGPKLTPEQLEDIQFGYHIAKEISRLEIGQLAIVKNGTVLAVEGFEGTDACLARGGGLAGKEGGAVAVKVAKENHDMRWDIPCFGTATLETCAKNKINVLAVESGKTLLLDPEEVKDLARKYGISVTTAG